MPLLMTIPFFMGFLQFVLPCLQAGWQQLLFANSNLN